MITANVTGGGSVSASVSAPQVVAASVSGGGQVNVAHQPAQHVAANVTGGVGPSGPPSRLADLLDVDVAAVAAGDVLRYAGDKWQGRHETALTDGGNF